MAASAASTALDIPRARTVRAAEGYAEMFSPDTPLVWWYGRLRYPEEPEVYRLTRWREALKRWWYDRRKQPKVSDESRPVFPDDRASRGSYAAARSLCRTRNCYVRAIPYGQTPFGDELFDNPTFIRPLLEPERDAEMAAAYSKTLEDFICPELQERVRLLTTALATQTAKIQAALEEDEHD